MPTALQSHKQQTRALCTRSNLHTDTCLPVDFLKMRIYCIHLKIGAISHNYPNFHPLLKTQIPVSGDTGHTFLHGNGWP